MTERGRGLRVGIGRIPEAHNTALYFERAARAAGHEVVVMHSAGALTVAGPFDLVLVVDPWFEGLQDLPGLDCPTAAVLIDVHRDLRTRAMFARVCDHAFVAQRDQAATLALSHDSVHWLPLGGDMGVHFVPDLPRDIDLGFVGKLGRPGTDRHAVLSHVLGRFRTNDYARPHTPWEMGRAYSRSRIVINKSIGCDVNMRVFEALAAGALLVTDRIGNGLDELLTEGAHYVGYDTAEEAVAKIERYLADEDARARIARSGQDILRAQHGYDKRLARILEVVQTAGDARPAPARRASAAQRRLWCAEWARRRGISVGGAAALVAEGLPPTGYPDLAVGLARSARRALRRVGA